jgi:hypothetical protein
VISAAVPAVHKWNLWFSDEGILVDEHVTHQAEQEISREAARQKAAKVTKRAVSHPSRPPRVNYDTMSSVDYIALRQADWFTQPREDLADTRFWCVAQKGIYEDVYRPMSQRVCYMHVLDRTHFRKKSKYFGDALGIMKRLGLF